MGKKSKVKKMELHVLSTARFLIGAKVVAVYADSIEVVKDGRHITIGYDSEGSYSDWWEVDVNLLISKGDLSKNPVITNVKQNGNLLQFVLFGLCRPIAEIKATFHNASDWDYGCTCSIFADGRELVCWNG